jgi:hypothetical protein
MKARRGEVRIGQVTDAERATKKKMKGAQTRRRRENIRTREANEGKSARHNI